MLNELHRELARRVIAIRVAGAHGRVRDLLRADRLSDKIDDLDRVVTDEISWPERLPRQPRNATVLCMLPDTGERYLSTPLFGDIPIDMTDEELKISRSMLSWQIKPASRGRDRRLCL